MDIVKRSAKTQKSVVALGNFDGLHKAHMTIIKKSVAEAEARGVKSAVLLFYEHTQDIIGKKEVKLILTPHSKMKILEEAGVDVLYMHHFDREFMELTPEAFVEFLITIANPVALSVGYDYRFGHKAVGDIETLKMLCQEKGIDVIVTDEVTENGIPVKSTAIREYLTAGEIEKANAMLGRNFTLRGKVKKGFQNGRKIGFPTANVDVDENIILPLDGVYTGYTTVDGVRYKSLVNVGMNPTVCGKEITVESHILDFDGDIYGKVIEVEFCRRIRGEIKFASLEDLKKQIQLDLEKVRQCF